MEHNDKMCAESLTGNTPNTPQFIRSISPNPPIIYDIFKRSPLHMSIVHDLYCIFIFLYFFFLFQQKSCSPSSFRGKFVQSLRSHATASWPQREIWGGEKWPQRNEQRLWKHCQSHKQRSKSTLQKKLEQSLSNKVEKILEGSLDSIPSPSMKIQIMGLLEV